MSNAAHDPDKRSQPQPDTGPRQKAPDSSGTPKAPQAPVDIAEESIAGEEDPGASLDTVADRPAAAPPPDKKGQLTGSG
jgi:hypothetical protein